LAISGGDWISLAHPGGGRLTGGELRNLRN
jgi:hypothetical protein